MGAERRTAKDRGMNIGDLVERLVAKGIAIGEASEIIALAVAAGASTAPYRLKPKQRSLFAAENEDRAIRGKKPLRPMPEPFPMTDKHREFAANKGFTNAEFIFDQFKSHHRAKGSQFALWDSAWQTWILNQVKFNGGAPQQPRPPGSGGDGRI